MPGRSCGFTPRAARPGASPRGDVPVRRPVLLGSSTPADALLSTRASGRRQDSASARTAPPLVAGACRQSGILAHRCPKIPTEPGICGVTHHSPVRVDTLMFDQMSRCHRASDQGGNPGFRPLPPRRAQLLGVGKAITSTPNRGTPFGPFESWPGRHAQGAARPDRTDAGQLSESGGTVTRAVRRSPSSTRSARASVGACSSLSPR